MQVSLSTENDNNVNAGQWGGGAIVSWHGKV